MIRETLKTAFISRLIPHPKEIVFHEGERILADGVPVRVQTVAPEAQTGLLAEESFRKFWNCVPELTSQVSAAAADFSEEEYEISVKPDGIVLTARGETGIRYALSTLRQLAEPVRGTMKTEAFVLPPCEISDKPTLAFRAVHICIFPETPMSFVEKEIRIAAYHKYNYAVIESWGVFPFHSHPEFGWIDKKKSEAEFRHMRDVARECGITLIPQFNIFGHATMSRVGTAKHAVLNQHPEYAPLFEPSGWSFCLSNPETRKVLQDLLLELFEFYGKPAYFHIGCDEADDFQTCRECASKDPVELLLEHLTYFRDLFAERKTRVIMWHDMLLEAGEPRWKNCIVCGNSRTAGVCRKLPKDIIIADWQYEEAPKSNEKQEWPTSLFFHESGFDVVVCPWMDRTGIRQLGAMAAAHNMFGMIETTWHTAFGQAFEPMYTSAACSAWSGGAQKEYHHPVFLAAHLRDVCRDMNLQGYEDCGHTKLQIAEKTTQP